MRGWCFRSIEGNIYVYRDFSAAPTPTGPRRLPVSMICEWFDELLSKNYRSQSVSCVKRSKRSSEFVLAVSLNIGNMYYFKQSLLKRVPLGLQYDLFRIQTEATKMQNVFLLLFFC